MVGNKKKPIKPTISPTLTNKLTSQHSISNLFWYLPGRCWLLVLDVGLFIWFEIKWKENCIKPNYPLTNNNCQKNMSKGSNFQDYCREDVGGKWCRLLLVDMKRKCKPPLVTNHMYPTTVNRLPEDKSSSSRSVYSWLLVGRDLTWQM